jgi:predicted nucleotidyltransferase component of viral defense system
MVAWLNETKERRLEILEQVSAETGIIATAIEKDWWVTITLRAIFQTGEGKNLIFKGGTLSLAISALLHKLGISVRPCQ